MLYHVNFCADPSEPISPLAELASVEADSPENGRATQVLRLPLVSIAEISIRSAKRRDHPAY